MKILMTIFFVLVTIALFLFILLFYLKWYFTRKGKDRAANGLPKTSLDYLQDYEKSLWSDVIPILIYLVVTMTVYLTIVLLLR